MWKGVFLVDIPYRLTRGLRWRTKESSYRKAGTSPSTPYRWGHERNRFQACRSLPYIQLPAIRHSHRTSFHRNKADEQIPWLGDTSALRDHATRRSRLRALVLDRISSPLRFAWGLLGAGHGRNSLGLSFEKKRKSAALSSPLCLVFVYYFVSLIGVSLARQGKVRPMFGAWLRTCFLRSGSNSLGQAERCSIVLSAIRFLGKSDQPHATVTYLYSDWDQRERQALKRDSTWRRVFSVSFPTLLDDYVLRDFFVYLGMILWSFLYCCWCSPFSSC